MSKGRYMKSGGAGKYMTRTPSEINKRKADTYRRDNSAPFKPEPFKSREDVSRYLSGSKITCLLCNDEFVGLGNHISMIHDMTAREYKIMFGIPVTLGLHPESRKNRFSDQKKKQYEAGVMKPVTGCKVGRRTPIKKPLCWYKQQAEKSKKGHVVLAKKIYKTQ